MCCCSNSCYKQRALHHWNSPVTDGRRGAIRVKEWEVEGDVGPVGEKKERGKLNERETVEGRVRRLFVLFFFHQINLTRHSHPSITSLPLTLSLSLYLTTTTLLSSPPHPTMHGWFFHSSRAAPLVTCRATVVFCMRVVVGVLMLRPTIQILPVFSVVVHV